MVSISLNKKRLLHDLGQEESEELLHQIVMMGLEVEETGGEELVVDVTPNRPDLLSQPGITRALQAFLGKKPGLRTYSTTPSKLKVFVDESAKDIRPYTACAVARNLRLDEELLKEIIDIQEKLHITFARRRKRAAIGIYPMEAIKGNITFKAVEPDKLKFRPLEMDKVLSAREILEQHPKGREYAHLLAGLPKCPVFVDSKGGVLSMPPVINSHDVGKVTVATTEVFIEASGSDFRICHEIVQMICAALADMGASIHTVEVVYGRKTEITPDMATKRQEFYGYYANQRLGLSLGKEEFAPLLARMGLGFEEGRIRETYYALVPPYRVDFLHQIDVVEDLAIAYGYDNITAALPQVATVAREAPMTRFSRLLRKVLVGYGLLEAKNYHLLGRAYQEKLDGPEMVTLASSVSEEYDAMRRTLLAGLLRTLAHNKVHEYPQAFFEIGTVFMPAPGHVIERERLGVIMAGDADYTRIRQIVEGVLIALGLSGEFRPAADARFIGGRCATLVINGQEAGVLGEVSPEALTLAEVTAPAAAAELDVDLLLRLVGK